MLFMCVCMCAHNSMTNLKYYQKYVDNAYFRVYHSSGPFYTIGSSCSISSECELSK